MDIQKQVALFDLNQRIAKAYQASSMIPKNFKENIGDCIIAIEMATRLKMNTLQVMQNMHIIHGKPSWSSAFIIACINACGRFTPLKFNMTGTANQDSRGCIAYCEDKATGDILESTEVTIKMAKAEGWYQKQGSKWQTMSDQMLKYRAASFFSRTYASDYLMGFQSKEELKDTIIDKMQIINEPEEKHTIQDLLNKDNINSLETIESE